MKKGFTLIELLATVVLLGLLVMLVYPKVMEQINKQEDKLTESKKQLIYSAMQTYLNDNEDLYPIREGKIYCIPLSTLVNEERVAVDVSDIDETLVVKVTISDTKTYSLVTSDKCTNS